MFRQLLNRREIFQMKSKTKKIIAVISAAAMALGLGACSKQTASDATKEVKLWMNSGHSKSFWEEKVNQFNDSQGKELGVKLVLESKTDSSYDQQLEIALQSGELPEMFFAGYATNIVDKEAVLSFDQLPGMEETIAKYEPYMQENIHKVKGKVYALPFGITTRGLIYNKDMFKAAGIVDENGEAKPPKTYDELREAAKKLTDKSKNQYGIMFPVKWGAWVESDITSLAYSSSGRDAYDPISGTYDYSIYLPELELIKNLKADGSVYPGAEGLDNDPARAKFAEGNIGMKISYSFDVGVFSTQFPTKMEWGVAPLPVKDADNCYNQHSYCSQTMYVNKNCIEKLGADTTSKIYQYLYSDEMIAELYKEGLEIPVIWDIVKDVELTDAANGWKEFSEMAAKSVIPSLKMPAKLNGVELSIQKIAVDEVWTKGTEPKAMLDELTKLTNEGIETYKAEKPDLDYSIYIDKDWETKSRRDTF